MTSRRLRYPLAVLVMGLAALPTAAMAYNLFDATTTSLDLNLEGVAAAFHSQAGYAQSNSARRGSREWQEGFLKYGLGGTHRTTTAGSSLYAKLDWISGGTWGQGDAAGFTTGEERRTHIEDFHVGWKSGELLPALGHDGVDFSLGRQSVQVGDGFLIAGDSLSFGKGILDGNLDRGGAYYLAGRSAFKNSAILRLGTDRGWHGDLMWLKSDNPTQAKPELAVTTLAHTTDAGTLGATYIDVLDVDDDYDLYPAREDTRVYSLRGQGNAGVEDLFLAAQYAYQRNGDGDNENAWYLEAGWTFSQFPWTPHLSYRFSRFSTAYDPLFYGNGRALGTWFQGEVAANYAGPFNTNARIQQLGLTLAPSESLAIGALLYRFDTLGNSSHSNLGGSELDLYAQWTLSEHWWVMPLIGRYVPSADSEHGGTQIGNRDANLYSQLLVGFNF